MFNSCIIMAGGSGTRLWPASTSLKPKQFLKIPGEEEKTFFGAALERALAATGEAEDGIVLIVAGKTHVKPIINECAALKESDKKRILLIPEPRARNTAPAICCALRYLELHRAQREQSILVLTSDHIIGPMNVFLDDARAAEKMAAKNNLVVFGIMPDRAETGFGYIEAGKNTGNEQNIFDVVSFHEKPDQNKAQIYLEAKNFYWNSGMFAFTKTFLLSEYEKNALDVISPFRELKKPEDPSYRTEKGLWILENWEKLEDVFNSTKAISFDYAIAEKCSSTSMVKANFSWVDVGSWDDYAGLKKSSKESSIKNSMGEVYGNKEALESCYVESEIPVALWGVEDLIVVVRSGSEESKPVILITKKGESQGIRDLTEEIKNAGKTEIL